MNITIRQIEAFLKVFEDATGTDLSQFARWYLNAGTPDVSASDSYDAANQTYTLTLTQKTAPTPNQPGKQALPIPVALALIGMDGAPMSLHLDGETGSGGTERVILFDREEATWRFTDVAHEPAVSLLRGYSAPVRLRLLNLPRCSGPRAPRAFRARENASGPGRGGRVAGP